MEGVSSLRPQETFTLPRQKLPTWGTIHALPPATSTSSPRVFSASSPGSASLQRVSALGLSRGDWAKCKINKPPQSTRAPQDSSSAHITHQPFKGAEELTKILIGWNLGEAVLSPGFAACVATKHGVSLFACEREMAEGAACAGSHISETSLLCLW